MTKAAEVKLELEEHLKNVSEYRKLDILWEDWGQTEEYTEVGDSGRWVTYQTTYWEFDDGSMLGIDWAKGNTEAQESEGPYEIYLAESYKVVTTKYRKVKDVI